MYIDISMYVIQWELHTVVKYNRLCMHIKSSWVANLSLSVNVFIHAIHGLQYFFFLQVSWQHQLQILVPVPVRLLVCIKSSPYNNFCSVYNAFMHVMFDMCQCRRYHWLGCNNWWVSGRSVGHRGHDWSSFLVSRNFMRNNKETLSTQGTNGINQ